MRALLTVGAVLASSSIAAAGCLGPLCHGDTDRNGQVDTVSASSKGQSASATHVGPEQTSLAANTAAGSSETKLRWKHADQKLDPSEISVGSKSKVAGANVEAHAWTLDEDQGDLVDDAYAFVHVAAGGQAVGGLVEFSDRSKNLGPDRVAWSFGFRI